MQRNEQEKTERPESAPGPGETHLIVRQDEVGDLQVYTGDGQRVKYLKKVEVVGGHDDEGADVVTGKIEAHIGIEFKQEWT